MLTLIKREFQSSVLYLPIPAILAVFSVGPVVYEVAFVAAKYPPIGVPRIMYTTLRAPMILLPLLFAILGATQMYLDRNRKISAFLATLATTRVRILLARIIVGLAFIVISLAPMVIADIILLRIYPRLAPVDLSLLIRMFLVILFVTIAAYTIGLLVGFRPVRFFPILPALLFCAPLLFLIVIKGYAVTTMILLLIIAAAALTRTWQNFTETPL